MLLAPIDLLGDPRQRTPSRIQPACIDEDCDQESKQVETRDDEDMEDLALFEGTIDVVAWSDEEEGGKDEGEGGESC